MANWCCLCKSDGESVSHLLLHCPIASDLWAFLFCLNEISWLTPNSVVLMLESWTVLGSLGGVDSPGMFDVMHLG